jgi:DNA replication ATP-dependent helicase Dna2
MIRFKKELWTVGARERETSGRCFADMELDTSYSAETDTTANGKIHQFTYRFTRVKKNSISPALSGSMTVGDAVIVSGEPNHLALARGFITELTSHVVTVGVDHELSSRRLRRLVGADDRGDDCMVFRIDKDDLSSGMGRIRDNLAQLFYVNGDERRRSLIVDLVQPRFSPLDEHAKYVSSSKFVSHLNDNQREAVTKVLATEDYSLVIGMPGTGKTTVITALIRILVDMGKTVLLTSHTHSAVDNILLKLTESDCGFGILRLGNTDKVGPSMHLLI